MCSANNVRIPYIKPYQTWDCSSFGPGYSLWPLLGTRFLRNAACLRRKIQDTVPEIMELHRFAVDWKIRVVTYANVLVSKMIKDLLRVCHWYAQWVWCFIMFYLLVSRFIIVSSPKSHALSWFADIFPTSSPLKLPSILGLGHCLKVFVLSGHVKWHQWGRARETTRTCYSGNTIPQKCSQGLIDLI